MISSQLRTPLCQSVGRRPARRGARPSGCSPTRGSTSSPRPLTSTVRDRLPPPRRVDSSGHRRTITNCRRSASSDPAELDGVIGRCRSFPGGELVQLAFARASTEALLDRRSTGGIAMTPIGPSRGDGVGIEVTNGRHPRRAARVQRTRAGDRGRRGCGGRPARRSGDGRRPDPPPSRARRRAGPDAHCRVPSSEHVEPCRCHRPNRRRAQPAALRLRSIETGHLDRPDRRRAASVARRRRVGRHRGSAGRRTHRARRVHRCRDRSESRCARSRARRRHLTRSTQRSHRPELRCDHPRQRRRCSSHR